MAEQAEWSRAVDFGLEICRSILEIILARMDDDRARRDTVTNDTIVSTWAQPAMPESSQSH
jgi:hypothetical protein